MKGDLDKDGVMSEYEQARQDAINANMREQKALGGVVGKIASLLSRRSKLEKELMTENMSKNNQNKTAKEIESLDEQVKELKKEIDKEPKQKGGSIDNQMMMVMSMPEESMESDDSMENNYTNFIMEEALTEQEEDMLTSKLEQDEELSMLFDKVIDVAQEFAGSGPVEGPGSGVSDSIPARLSDGEFVFTTKAVKEIGEDTLMSMMKEAEAAADKRQELNIGGQPMIEEEKVDQNGKPIESDIVDDEIRKGMLSTNPRLRQR